MSKVEQISVMMQFGLGHEWGTQVLLMCMKVSMTEPVNELKVEGGSCTRAS